MAWGSWKGYHDLDWRSGILSQPLNPCSTTPASYWFAATSLIVLDLPSAVYQVFRARNMEGHPILIWENPNLKENKAINNNV